MIFGFGILIKGFGCLRKGKKKKKEELSWDSRWRKKKKGEKFRIKIFFYVGILVSSETI